MKRFEDRVDEIADRLDEAAETFRTRRYRALEELRRAKEEYDDEILKVEDWAYKEGLIDAVEWTDAEGEPFLPFARVEVLTELVPDLATMFRERVAVLLAEKEEA